MQRFSRQWVSEHPGQPRWRQLCQSGPKQLVTKPRIVKGIHRERQTQAQNIFRE